MRLRRRTVYSPAVLTEVQSSVHVWQSLEIELKRHINGYLFLTRVGGILVDPPSAAEPVLAQIEAFGKPRAIIVTGRNQERRSRQYQGWYKAKVFAPEADRKRLRITADHYFRTGESLPGGFKSIILPHQRTPGETVLFHEKAKILVAPHFVTLGDGLIQMEDRASYWNFSRGFEAQLALLELDFDVLLPGRGKPIKTGARIALAKFLAGYEG